MRYLANGGWDIRAEMRFPDHHRYTPGDCARIVREMDRHQVAACVTTEKDAVRLGADPEVAQRLWESSEVLYPRIDVEILRGEETLTALIDRYLSLAAGSVASGAAGRRG